jgi:8-oxo-dGTP diphosphatase
METNGEQVHDLMDDVRAVDWLPLDAAVERLSRPYERAFLENVGPLALEAAAKRPRARKQPALQKRRRQPAASPQPSPAMPIPDAPRPDLLPPVAAPGEPLVMATVKTEASIVSTAFAERPAEEISAATALDQRSAGLAVEPVPNGRINLVQKVRDWLRRAA